MALNDNHYLLTSSNSPDSNGVHSIPAYVVKTGTMTNASGETKVVGVSTLFLTEIQAGDWLVVSGKQARRVQSVVNNLLLWLDEGFSGGSGAGVKVYVAPYSRFKKISIFPQTGSSGTIDGVTLQAAEYYSFEGSPTADVKTVVCAGGNIEVTTSNG